jgi:TolB protein
VTWTVRTGILVLAATMPMAVPLPGQDSIPGVEGGVRLGITYTPGMRPGMLVLGGPSTGVLDSVRTILRRDLDFSDRFEIITLPQGDGLMIGIGQVAPVDRGGTASVFVNYPLYAALGADYTVGVLAEGDSAQLVVSLYDVRGESVRRQFPLDVRNVTDPGSRMAVHRVADAVVRAATGVAGAAATRLAFVQGRRLYTVDPDGANLVPMSPAELSAFSPAWGPSGQQLVFAELTQGLGRLHVIDLVAGSRRLIRPTGDLLNFAAAFSPDGRFVAFSRSGEDGTDVYTYNLAQDCCLQRLTVGRFSDNLSPTFSPDGRRIAFVSTRVGLPQIYVMSADGTGQELFAPFDYGVTGSSNAPEWSPDGTQIAFHRDVAGSPQVFLMDVRSRDVKQLTSAGRNEDPTWAPDGRHLAFVSNRTGSRQVWVIDTETGRVRQLTTIGGARLPAWSPHIPEQANP